LTKSFEIVFVRLNFAPLC